MIDDYIVELLGEWIQDYPYIRATADYLVLIIAFIFLFNLNYFLGKLLTGER